MRVSASNTPQAGTSSASTRATTGGLSIYAGERTECSLCDGHAVTNVSIVSAVTPHSRPQILERVDVRDTYLYKCILF